MMREKEGDTLLINGVVAVPDTFQDRHVGVQRRTHFDQILTSLKNFPQIVTV